MSSSAIASGVRAGLLLEELVQAVVRGILHHVASQESMLTTEPVPERLSVKNAHQNTNTTEMPILDSRCAHIYHWAILTFA